MKRSCSRFLAPVLISLFVVKSVAKCSKNVTSVDCFCQRVKCCVVFLLYSYVFDILLVYPV